MPFDIGLIKKHSSLLLIFFGAGCFFLSNIIFKQQLSDHEFGIYSLVITYLSLIYIFGILGYEQVFLRYSNSYQKDIISTQKLSIYIVLFTSIIVSSLSTYFFYKYYIFQYYNIFLLFITTLCMIICMNIFSILRLNEDYTSAQLVANFWKIFLFLICSLFFFIDDFPLHYIINSLSFIIILFTICFLIYIKRKIKFEYDFSVSKKTLYQSFIYFFISITSFSIITFGDRFIIEKKLDIETLGTYFFLSNFILAPYNILQNYIGFKQLSEYKKEINQKKLLKNIMQSLSLGIGLGLFLMILTYFTDYINLMQFKFKDWTLEIVLFLGLGIIKLYSAIISPAFEVRTSIRMLKIFNCVFITSTFILFYVLLKFNKTSMIEVIIVLSILWLIRTVLQHFLLSKNIFSH